MLAMAMDTEASLQEYLRLNLRVPMLGRLGPLAKVFDFVATAAPGVREILTVGKIMWEVRESVEGRADFDLVVVDAAATGHIVAQLGAADTIRDFVDVGPLRNQTQWVSELLADPAVTAVNIVTTPEEMPVAETIDLVGRLRREVNVPLGAVIVNRVLPELFTHADEETFEAFRAPASRELLTARLGGGATEVLDAARLVVSLRRTRAAHLEELRRRGRSAAAVRAIPLRSSARPARYADGRRCARRGARVLRWQPSRAVVPTTNPRRSSSSSPRRRSLSSAAPVASGRPRSPPRAALGAAVRLGGKVLVLTIDPAKRLATALGLEGIGNLAHQVPPEVLKEAGIEPRGELWAAMLDTKQSWDDLVLRYAKDEETAYRILENRLYHNLTARFVQSHDYIAMERLFELHSSGQYDLIVIDTPPTRNAIDFLEAPARMADFFGGRLLRWLTLPYRVGGKRGTRVLNVASRPFYQVADRVLGSQFLEEIAEFFQNFQGMYDGFVHRAKAVERLLRDRRTTFAVVTTLEAAPLHEAERFCSELVAHDFHLGALVLNKTLPDSLLDPAGARAAQSCIDDAAPIADTLETTGEPALADPSRTARVLRTIGQSFQNFSVVAMREAELRSELARVPDVVTRIPTLADDVSDVGGLSAICEYLYGARP